MAVDRDREKFDYLCQLARRGLIARNARQHAKLSGSAAAGADPLFSSANPPAMPSALTLDGLISAYENDPGRAGGTKKTQLDYAMTFRALARQDTAIAVLRAKLASGLIHAA